MPPQPSEIEPQFLPAKAHEVRVQPQDEPASASQLEQAPARQLAKPNAAQSSSRRKPSWQYLTVAPSQLALSADTVHSLPVSTHRPASQRFRLALRAQSARMG